MLRRIHVAHLTAGPLMLAPAQAHHVRDVLRLSVGDRVELFDDAGATAEAVIDHLAPEAVGVRVANVAESVSEADVAIRLTIASAVPKAQRADWMIEKLSELGIDRFIPLATARSVVVPEGKNKLERWRRISIEAARQSRRRGVMRIEAVIDLGAALRQVAGEVATAWHLSTAPGAIPLAQRIGGLDDSAPARGLTLFVGPEGGWTPEEIDQFEAAGVGAASLTATVLRVETAAVAAAAVVAAMLDRGRRTGASR